MPILDIQIGDIYRMRKPHPCGSYEWRVNRTGADIGMICQQCGRRVLLPRSTFERRVKTLLARGVPAPQAAPAGDEVRE